jgi:hypothetical protein
VKVKHVLHIIQKVLLDRVKLLQRQTPLRCASIRFGKLQLVPVALQVRKRLLWIATIVLGEHGDGVHGLRHIVSAQQVLGGLVVEVSVLQVELVNRDFWLAAHLLQQGPTQNPNTQNNNFVMTRLPVK